MSAIRLAEQYLSNQKAQIQLNAFITPFFQQRNQRWLDQLVKSDRRRQNGRLLSEVDGKLIAVKDNICTTDFATTCASGILKDFTSPYNATVVQLLEASGAVIAGKTNLDEFGMGSHSMHSHFGPVINPRYSREGEVSAGGSSGGSAVAVATDQCIAALGTDTGGSVRLPAAYTGVVGFKPSYGLISRWGVVAYANSLDTVGVLGKNCGIVRTVFDILNKFDRRDPTSLPPQTRSRVAEALNWQREGPLRIGVPIEYNILELTPEVKQAWVAAINQLKGQGHSIHSVSLPATKQALPAYYVLAPAEASSNLAKYDGIRYGTRSEATTDSDAGCLYAQTRGEGFGPEVRRRILLGSFSLSAEAMDNYFIQAQKVRRLVQEDFNKAFRIPHPLQESDSGRELGVDVLVCPTAPTLPPYLRSAGESSPIDAYMNDVFTVPASLAGLPAISVPIAVTEESQVNRDMAGIQVIGQYGCDDLVLQVAEMVEETPANLQAPTHDVHSPIY